jgi:hypothetical protein
MTASPIEHPACRCGHSHEQHAALSPQCSATRCECLRYRPDTPAVMIAPTVTAPVGITVVPVNAPAKPPTGTTVEQLLDAGKKSKRKRTAALAHKITGEIRDLSDRLAEEDQTAKALAEIAQLEKQLAAAKARIKTIRHDVGLPGGERTAGAGACPECGEVFDTAQRLGVHRRWKHDYRKPAAS